MNKRGRAVADRAWWIRADLEWAEFMVARARRELAQAEAVFRAPVLIRASDNPFGDYLRYEALVAEVADVVVGRRQALDDVVLHRKSLMAKRRIILARLAARDEREGRWNEAHGVHPDPPTVAAGRPPSPPDCRPIRMSRCNRCPNPSDGGPGCMCRGCRRAAGATPAAGGAR